jgi:Rieske 2Fe-2S family protein
MDGSLAPPIDPALLEPVLRPRAEASLLPAQAYADQRVLAWELARLFQGSWTCIGREQDAAGPGDLFTARVGDESILVVRGDDDAVRAFFNVCQHRGTELVDRPQGHADGVLICPYHSWTYGLDGRLRTAQHMTEARNFDKASCSLTPVPAASLGGWVFVNVSGTAPGFDQHLANFAERIERYGCESLRRAARIDYLVGANWKLLSENYQECYHCPTIHPDLVKVTPYRSASNDESHGPWVGGPMDLSPGCTTMSLTGVTDRAPIPGLLEVDHRRVLYYTLLPNLWISLHPDYVMTHRVSPVDATHTTIVCEWLFASETMAAPGFDPSDAVSFWDAVNRQDWAACERVQRAIGSRGFRGGRFSDMEDTVHLLSATFARSYLRGELVPVDQALAEVPLPAS